MGKYSSDEDRRRSRRDRDERQRSRSRSRSRSQGRRRKDKQRRSRSREDRRRQRSTDRRRSSKHKRQHRSSSKSRRDRHHRSRSRSRSRSRRRRSRSSSRNRDRRKRRDRSLSSSSGSSRSRPSSREKDSGNDAKKDTIGSKDSSSYIPSIDALAKIESAGFASEAFVSHKSSKGENGDVALNSHDKSHDDAMFGTSGSHVLKKITGLKSNDLPVQSTGKESGVMASLLHKQEDVKNDRWMKKLQSMREKKLLNS